MEKVIITVKDGVAELWKKSDNVIVKIIDFDNNPDMEIPKLEDIKPD